ncbi:MAG: ABC transporter permease [Candidatus Binataceae bacterium]
MRMKELQREPEVIFWVFGFPLLIAFGLGIAFANPAPTPSRIQVVSAAGEARLETLLAAQPEVVVQPGKNLAQALNDFRLGRSDLVVVPQGTGAELRYDSTRPESVLARLRALRALEATAAPPPMAVRSQVSSLPGSRYIDFLIPGLIGMDLMNSGMWGVGFALVEMRQRKLLKRLAATPMRRGDFLAATLSSRLLLMLVELGLLLGAGVWAFQLRVMGSWGSILLVSTLGAIVFGGLGLLTASRVEKIESVSGIMNLVMMPMWVLSGVFFSYERFPKVFLPWIRMLPLTALNDALRAVILEGAPLHAQLARLAVLGVWCIVCFSAALAVFRWS